jgi:hypothetical protein
MENNSDKVTRGLVLSLAWSLIGGVILAAFLVNTTPRGIGNVGVTAWFILLFSWVTAVFSLVSYSLKSFLKVGDSRTSRLRHSRRQAVLVSSWVVSILAFASLRQLEWQDGIIIGLLLILVEIYVRLRWP